MHRRRTLAVVALAHGLVLLLSGCRTPKHTNVLIFATNTSGGLNVGYEPTNQNATLLVGYKRQEGVWMPLLANRGDKGDTPGGRVEPDYYTGSAESGDHHEVDTYSVIASIGAKFGAKGSGTAGVEGQGGLAQFFATGLAARALADQGGALLVNAPSAPVANAIEAQADAKAEEAKARQVEAEALKGALAENKTRQLKLKAEVLTKLIRSSDEEILVMYNAAKAEGLLAQSQSEIPPGKVPEMRKALIGAAEISHDPIREKKVQKVFQ